MSRLVCQSCGAPVTREEPIARDAECEQCRTDLRCCRNCRHWNPRVNNECTETEAERVVDKQRRNFCEYFYFIREAYAGGAGAGRDRAAEARAKLDALFRKNPGGEAGEE